MPTQLIDFFSSYHLQVAIVSFVFFIGSLMAIPLIIKGLPQDYFIQQYSHRNKPYSSFGFQKISYLIVKNIVGIAFIFSGFIMLFLPGQGLITIAIGITLTNFPGKRTLVKTLLKSAHLQKSLNWVRKNSKLPPFTFPN